MVRRGQVVALLLALGRVAAAEPSLAQFTDGDPAAAGWRPKKAKEGVTLEQRAVAGSAYNEYRSVVDVPGVEPERAAALIWEVLKGGDMDSLKHRDILRASDDELVIYDQIRTPIVSDRDYTFTVRRLHDAARRRTQFRCVTTNELGPPPAAGYVRIPIIRAGWMTEPNGDGGTRLSYFAYSEPGGSVAAFLVRGAQADRSLADMLRMRRRLQQLPPPR